MPEDIKLHVKDVMGPIPNGDLAGDSAVAFVLTSEGKMIALPCSLSDADACLKVLKGTSRNGPTLYHYMLDVLGKHGLTLWETRLEQDGDKAISKIIFRPMAEDAKATKIISPNPMLSINFSLVGGRELIASKAVVAPRRDVISIYGNLCSVFASLWPLPPIKYTAQLEVLSEIADEILCQPKAV